jgi:hypothetical protein
VIKVGKLDDLALLLTKLDRSAAKGTTRGNMPLWERAVQGEPQFQKDAWGAHAISLVAPIGIPRLDKAYTQHGFAQLFEPDPDLKIKFDFEMGGDSTTVWDRAWHKGSRCNMAITATSMVTLDSPKYNYSLKAITNTHGGAFTPSGLSASVLAISLWFKGSMAVLNEVVVIGHTGIGTPAAGMWQIVVNPLNGNTIFRIIDADGITPREALVPVMAGPGWTYIYAEYVKATKKQKIRVGDSTENIYTWGTAIDLDITSEISVLKTQTDSSFRNIDHISLLSRVLTAEEITDHYSGKYFNKYNYIT